MDNMNPISAQQEQHLTNVQTQANLRMSFKGKGQTQIEAIPRWCGLEYLVEIDPTHKGVELETLEPFDTIWVRTLNSEYRIFLLDPKTGRALVEGGRHFVEPVEATVSGSTFGGCTIKMGWIGIGLRLEFWTERKWIHTSTVQSVLVGRHTSTELTPH